MTVVCFPICRSTPCRKQRQIVACGLIMSACGVSMPWVMEDVAEFVDEDKNIIDMACDEELSVVGLSGWPREAKVYDINTWEKKFVLKCNALGDTLAPFSNSQYGTEVGHCWRRTFTRTKKRLQK